MTRVYFEIKIVFLNFYLRYFIRVQNNNKKKWQWWLFEKIQKYFFTEVCSVSLPPVVYRSKNSSGCFETPSTVCAPLFCDRFAPSPVKRCRRIQNNHRMQTFVGDGRPYRTENFPRTEQRIFGVSGGSANDTTFEQCACVR